MSDAREAMSKPANLPPSGIDRLRAIIAAFRDPNAGCPWDILQTFASIAPYTFAQRKENRITVLPFDIPQPNRSLGILRRVSPTGHRRLTGWRAMSRPRSRT